MSTTSTPAPFASTPTEGAVLTMRVVPMPCDTNAHGAIFGGWLMAQLDLAGSVLAARLAKGRIVTVAVNSVVFKQPVAVGDLLSFWSKVERIGRTSVTVRVEVLAERNPANPDTVNVTDAILTYVAIDDHGRPRPLDPSAAADGAISGAPIG